MSLICCSAREGRRFHMGWLQLKRWLSFLPAAFVVYILLHYLVYQPADLASRHNQPVLVSVPRSADGSDGAASGVSAMAVSRTLQSGPRVLPLVHQPSAPDGDATGESQAPQQTAAVTGGIGTNESGLIVTSDSPPALPPQHEAAAAVASKEDINNTGTGGGITPDGNGDPTSAVWASKFDSSSDPGSLLASGSPAGADIGDTGGLLLLGGGQGGLIGASAMYDTGYMSSGSEGHSPQPETASRGPADEVSVSTSAVSALSASRRIAHDLSQPFSPVIPQLPPRFNASPKVAPLPQIKPEIPSAPAQSLPNQPQLSPYEPVYAPVLQYGESSEYGYGVGVDRDHYVVGYHDPAAVAYDPYSPSYHQEGLHPLAHQDMRKYFIADDSYNNIIPPADSPHHDPPRKTRTGCEMGDRAFPRGQIIELASTHRRVTLICHAGAWRERKSASGPSVGNSNSNKIVVIAEDPQPKSPTAQAQASSSPKLSGKVSSTSQTAKASAVVPAAPPSVAKESSSKPQAGVGAAAGLGDKIGSVATGHSAAAAKKSPQTVTKKTTVVKKSNVASTGGLAINALKGKTTVGQKYESGFSFPHEELCINNGRELKVLVLITTAPDHEKHRTAIRQTWGHWNLRKDVVMAFMVGRTSNANTQNIIDKENEQYSDLIQANFIDHYSNLTLKTVSMFEWVKTYCSESHFVLKTDDDMFINMPYLLSFIDSKKNDKKVMYGRLAKGWKPVRNRKSKYFIDTATYSKTKYPDFLTGPAYLFTSDIVDDIYSKALSTTFFVLEDVLLTGIVGESLRIKRVGDSRFRNEKIKLTDTCQLLKTISIHMVKYEEQFDIYKRTLDGKAKCKQAG